jgi:hypothetical protein
MIKLPWKLFTDRPPGCSQCEKDGAKAIEIENADGKVIFHWGHDTMIDEEFDFEALVQAVNMQEAKSNAVSS